MSKKSLVLLCLLAVLPIVTFAWLGWRVARTESLRVRQQYQSLLDDRLAEENRKVRRYFDERQRELSDLVDRAGDSTSSLRHLVRETPLVHQVIVLDRQGDLIHPRPGEAMNQGERDFLGEIQQMIDDRDLVRLAFPANSTRRATEQPASRRRNSVLPAGDRRPDGDEQTGRARKVSERTPATVAEGWFSWYWGRGVNLMYWRRRSDDRLTVIALSRARWMSDILALLPETRVTRADTSAGATRQRVCLVDSSDRVIYQWGTLQPRRSANPVVEASVAAPLSAWRLKYYVDPTTYGRPSYFPILAGLVGMACGLLGLVVVLYRDYARDMHEARQRVNFVNQVSHELKTPLTNIRLYADLLDRDLDRLPDTDLQKPRSRLAVITAESQRLSRLISNVLTFARSERKQLHLHLQPTDLDEVVREIVQRFRPIFETHDMRVEVTTQFEQTMPLDRDAVQQILENVLSNALRYAEDGRFVGIRTFGQDEDAVVEVFDKGPGIGKTLAVNIFEPFVRGASGLSDTAGTGIGLSIARRLAHLHGGDLTLVPSTLGATFRLVLPRKSNHESAAGRR